MVTVCAVEFSLYVGGFVQLVLRDEYMVNLVGLSFLRGGVGESQPSIIFSIVVVEGTGCSKLEFSH